MNGLYILIIIVVVILIVAIIWGSRNNSVHHHHSPQVENSKSNPKAISNSSQKNYKVIVGQKREITTEEIERMQRLRAERMKVQSANGNQTNSIQNANNQGFPRHAVQASNKSNSNFKVENSSKPKHTVKLNHENNTVHVDRIANLFSVKDNFLQDYNVTKEEMDALVEKYKASKEYKERRVPINKNFDLQEYNNARGTIRDSTYHNKSGSKKGNIMVEVWKTYGKTLTKKQRPTASGNVDALGVSEKDHANAIQRSKARSNMGTLVSRR